MALPLASEQQVVRKTGGDNSPPQSPVLPRGAEHEAPIPHGVEKQAQILIHQAGSLELAKDAVDGAAEREAIPDFREDLFAQRFGFASRLELLAASTPLIAADVASWWTTTVADNRWIVWNQNDMSAAASIPRLPDLGRGLIRQARKGSCGPVQFGACSALTLWYV